jgi:hypothetical protein
VWGAWPIGVFPEGYSYRRRFGMVSILPRGWVRYRSEAFLRKGINLLPELITNRFVLNNEYLFIALKVETLELELD